MDNNPIKYQLARIDLLAKNLAPVIIPVKDGTVFKFDIQVESKIDLGQKHVIVVVDVETTREDTREIVGSIKTACSFYVDNFDNHIKMNQENIYNIPADLENAIRPICISTTRGIMFSEFKGTYLHHVVLPVVMVNVLGSSPNQPDPEVEK
jgi:hypothetical protein